MTENTKNTQVVEDRYKAAATTFGKFPLRKMTQNEVECSTADFNLSKTSDGDYCLMSFEKFHSEYPFFAPVEKGRFIETTAEKLNDLGVKTFKPTNWCFDKEGALKEGRTKSQIQRRGDNDFVGIIVKTSDLVSKLGFEESKIPEPNEPMKEVGNERGWRNLIGEQAANRPDFSNLAA